MHVIVTYDVNTEDREGRRRLRRVAKVCESFGQRVQFSVFECTVGQKELLILRSRLKAEIDEEKDSLRIYHLNKADRSKIEHYGLGKPRDFEEDALVI